MFTIDDLADIPDFVWTLLPAAGYEPKPATLPLSYFTLFERRMWLDVCC
jgi:hypothetical protein